METVIVVIVGLMILIGLVGVFIPALPGPGLIFLGALIYGAYFGWGTVGIGTLVILGVLMLLATASDYLTAAYGTKRFGGSRYASIGALLGGILGLLILSLPGLAIGLFVGAFIGERFYAKKGLGSAIQAGQGALWGYAWGVVTQLIIALIMVGIFLWKALL